MLLRVVREQPYSAVAVPKLERGRLVLALAVRLLDLEDDLVSRGCHGRLHDDRGDPAVEGLAEGQAPVLDQAGAGQRYASA